MEMKLVYDGISGWKKSSAAIIEVPSIILRKLITGIGFERRMFLVNTEKSEVAECCNAMGPRSLRTPLLKSPHKKSACISENCGRTPGRMVDSSGRELHS